MGEMQPAVLMALVTGHLLGDFVLQSDGLAERKARSVPWLLLHVLAVALVTWVLLGTVAAWWIAAVLFVAHVAIDGLKRAWSGADGGAGRLFALDQALHVLSLLLVWWAARHWGGDLEARNHWLVLWGDGYRQALLLVSGAAATVWALGVVLRFQMAGFAAQLPPGVREGLPLAGRTVGHLERLLVFVFVLAGHPEAVGFVVAAKSVFRIGDLTNRDEKNHAEYIMIGTLRSFAYALILAFATRWLVGNLGG